MHRKPRTLLVHVLAAVVLLGGVLSFAAFSRTITISVDGEQRQVRTFALTVGQALDREHVVVGERDALVPSRDEALRDGQVVTIRTGRPLVIDVDGRGSSTIWTTAPTVDEALNALGVRADSAYLSVSRSMSIPRQGIAVVVRTPQTVDVLVDGQRREVVTTAATTGDVLKEVGVTLAASDQVSASLETPPTDGAVIEITRVSGTQRTTSAPVKFRTIEQRSDAYFVGFRSVTRKGKPGVVVRVLEQRTINGRKTAERVVSQRYKVRPVPQIVVVGTKKVPRTESSIANLNWAGLAKCESGGRPTARSRNGLYYGLYQFLPATWRAVGGTGLPSDAAPAEQTYRAQRLFKISNWRTQWPVCGKNLFT